MIPHQHPGMNAPARHLTSLRHGFQEKPPVIVIEKDRLPPVATSHHVVERAGILNAETAGHGLYMAKPKP